MIQIIPTNLVLIFLLNLMSFCSPLCKNLAIQKRDVKAVSTNRRRLEMQVELEKDGG